MQDWAHHICDLAVTNDAGHMTVLLAKIKLRGNKRTPRSVGTAFYPSKAFIGQKSTLNPKEMCLTNLRTTKQQTRIVRKIRGSRWKVLDSREEAPLVVPVGKKHMT